MPKKKKKIFNFLVISWWNWPLSLHLYFLRLFFEFVHFSTKRILLIWFTLIFFSFLFPIFFSDARRASSHACHAYVHSHIDIKVDVVKLIMKNASFSTAMLYCAVPSFFIFYSSLIHMHISSNAIRFSQMLPSNILVIVHCYYFLILILTLIV